MENQRESIEILLANRVYLYEMFHVVFSGVPNEELIHILSGEQTRAAFAILSADEKDMMAKMARFTQKLDGKLTENEKFMDNLKSEYTKLLIGPGRLVAYPWESTYNGKENLLFQESTLRVRQFYRTYGYLPQEYPHVADDHIALELHFMAKLSQRALDAFQADDLETCHNLLDGQKVFLKYHMLNWIPQYAENIKKSKTAHMYPQFAQGVDAFIKIDDEFIQEATDWIDTALEAQAEAEAAMAEKLAEGEESIWVTTILLPNEDGGEDECAILNEFEFEGVSYMVVADIVEGDIIDESSSEILRYTEDGEELIVDTIDDEDEYQRVDEFYRALLAEEDEDECGEGCDCGSGCKCGCGCE
ncbi:MAG: molecular chaperone TorD family protein [Lachnospiraceae bacterium]|nr:molecular chaperone TorD family protein [Lachnospiraceae bacterium]